MYYEVHGSGRPLVLLHGAFGTAESWASVLPAWRRRGRSSFRNNKSTATPAEDVKSIKASALIMIGDHEGIRPEHAVEMFRMIPGARLAIFPGADHFLLFTHPDQVLGTLLPFLEAPSAGRPSP
jgi:pimeloyl-ACP methyl ester carboxylesterase